MSGAHQGQQSRERPSGPCPDCGARVGDGALLCTSCFTWRPRRARVRTPSTRVVRHGARERRLVVGGLAVLASLGAVSAAAQAARTIRRWSPTVTAPAVTSDTAHAGGGVTGAALAPAAPTRAAGR